MAKKTVIQPAAMDATKKSAIIDDLQKALEITNSHSNGNEKMFEVEKIEQVPQETKEETISEPIQEQTNAEQTNAETTEAEIPQSENKNKSSMFEDMFNMQTEEDLKKQTSRAEHILETVSDTDLEDDDLDLNEDSPLVKKQTADVEATMIIEGGEMVLSVLCMWIAKDWEAFSSNKYVIGKEKKKALKIAIMKMILLKNKKRSPIWSIVGLCIGASVPMFAMALLTLKAKQKQQKDNEALIAQQRALILAENEKAAREYAERLAANEMALKENLSNTGQVNPIVIKRESAPPLVVVKKESRGRHKKGCAYYKGKPCNCKK